MGHADARALHLCLVVHLLVAALPLPRPDPAVCGADHVHMAEAKRTSFSA